MTTPSPTNNADQGQRNKWPAPVRLALSVFGFFAGLTLIGALLLVFMMMMAYPNLPDIDSLATYQPKMPLRVFSADNMLIGEFGEERRSLVRYKDIPKVMKQAVLAIEDDRFYEHHGVDYWGILRAAIHNAQLLDEGNLADLVVLILRSPPAQLSIATTRGMCARCASKYARSCSAMRGCAAATPSSISTTARRDAIAASPASTSRSV